MNNQLNSIGNMATRNLSTRNQETLENDMDLASNESTDHNGTNCRAGVFVVCSVVALVLIQAMVCAYMTRGNAVMHVSSDNSDDDDDKTVPSEGDEGDNLDLEIASESSRKDEERICDPE